MSKRILTKSVYDIEDLTKLGKLHNSCPYYLARSKLSNVDIAVIPYHYILTPSIRKKLPLQIENSIVIFDEAHNLEHLCEQIMSFKLSVDKLKYCDQILNQLDKKYREKDVNYTGVDEKIGDKLDETEILRTFIEHLKKVIEKFPTYGRHLSNQIRGNTEYFMYDISEIHTILEEALRPVFRIDRTERKKKKIMKKRG